jgi:hypothetical protein
MQDIIKVLLAAIAAGVGAVCVICAVGALSVGVLSIVGPVLSAGLAVAPIAVCVAGIAIASTKCGY